MFISKKSFTNSCMAMHAIGYKEGVKDGISSTYGKTKIYVDSDSIHAYHVVRVDRETNSRTPVTSDETIETAISKMNILNASTSLTTCFYTIEVF